MKNVLIITRWYHKKEIIGSIRLRGLKKYITQFNWNPIILTVKEGFQDEKDDSIFDTEFVDVIGFWKQKFGINPEKRIKEHFLLSTSKNKFNFFDLLYLFMQEICYYPDEAKYWLKPALQEVEKILVHYKIDALISSAHPVTSHIIAKILHEKYCIPWIADFRDPWTQNPYYRYSMLRKTIDSQLEKAILQNANAVTAISKPIIEDFQRIVPRQHYYVIQNGFDPDLYRQKSDLTQNFSIIYTGFLQFGKRDPSPLFEALNNLIKSGKILRQDLSIHFYGAPELWLTKEVLKFGLSDVVHIHGQVSREEALEAQRKAQILLLLSSNDPKEVGWYTGKLFDYLAARRPILSIGYRHSAANSVITETKTGHPCTTVHEVEETLLLLYDEYKRYGMVLYNGVEDSIFQYSQVNMAKKFADVLNTL